MCLRQQQREENAAEILGVQKAKINELFHPNVGIENQVYTCHLYHECDNLAIAIKLGGLYDRNVFSAPFLTFAYPRVRLLVFKTGRISVVGAKGFTDALLAIYIFTDALARVFGKTKKFIPYDFQLQNAVACARYGHKLNVDLFYADHQDTAMFEPDSFSAVRYTHHDPDVVCLVYSTGNIVIAGARRLSEVVKAYCALESQLHLHRYIQGHEYRQLEEREKKTRHSSMSSSSSSSSQSSSSSSQVKRRGTKLTVQDVFGDTQFAGVRRKRNKIDHDENEDEDEEDTQILQHATEDEHAAEQTLLWIKITEFAEQHFQTKFGATIKKPIAEEEED